MGRSGMAWRGLFGIGTMMIAACGGAASTPAHAAPPARPIDVPAPAASAPPAAAAAPAPAPPPAREAPPSAPAASEGPRFNGVPGTSIRFTGGDGSSVEHAIAIEGAKGETDGVQAEYWYADQVFGRRGADWQFGGQALLEHEGHHFDKLDLKLKSGEARVLVFDITDYFGKF